MDAVHSHSTFAELFSVWPSRSAWENSDVTSIHTYLVLEEWEGPMPF
jgi:hypothetical protein